MTACPTATRFGCEFAECGEAAALNLTEAAFRFRAVCRCCIGSASYHGRASLNNPGDRHALQAHPDAIELPLEQIRDGGVYVAEVAGAIRGFAAILPRDDGDCELDALFVEPDVWRRGIGRELVEHCAAAACAAGDVSLHVVGKSNV